MPTRTQVTICGYTSHFKKKICPWWSMFDICLNLYLYVFLHKVLVLALSILFDISLNKHILNKKKQDTMLVGYTVWRAQGSFIKKDLYSPSLLSWSAPLVTVMFGWPASRYRSLSILFGQADVTLTHVWGFSHPNIAEFTVAGRQVGVFNALDKWYVSSALIILLVRNALL